MQAFFPKNTLHSFYHVWTLNFAIFNLFLSGRWSSRPLSKHQPLQPLSHLQSQHATANQYHAIIRWSRTSYLGRKRYHLSCKKNICYQQVVCLRPNFHVIVFNSQSVAEIILSYFKKYLLVIISPDFTGT